MKIFILADGKATRWGDYKGIPKQKLIVNGEPIIDRMIRLCHERGIDKQHIIIVGDFTNENAINIKLPNCEDKRHLFIEIAKISQEPFILLNGDCYYTDEIIEDCLTNESKKWLHYCCNHDNPYTGKPWGEGYIHKVIDWEWWIYKLTELNEKVDSGEIKISNDWTINGYLADCPNIYEAYKELNEYDVYWCDTTDDFDYSSGSDWGTGYNNDYERFIAYTKYKGM